MSSSKIPPKDVSTSAAVNTKEGDEKSDSSSSSSSSDLKKSVHVSLKGNPSKTAVAADESPSLEKYGGWIHPLPTKRVAAKEPNKIAADEDDEKEAKSSPPAVSSSSDDRPELMKRKKSTPRRKVGYKKKKQQHLMKKAAADHRHRRAQSLLNFDQREVDGGTCCRHCCCCRCHDIISYTHGEGGSDGRRSVERFIRKPVRRIDKKRSPATKRLKNARNTTPSPLSTEGRERMEEKIGDECLEDVRLASMIVNHGEECFRNALAECNMKPNITKNIDKTTHEET